MKTAAPATLAIAWIVDNDAAEWLNADDEIIPSVTTSLVADLFGRGDQEVIADLQRALRRQRQR